MRKIFAPLILLTLVACKQARNDWDMSGQDTVPAAQFAPLKDSVESINLKALTGVQFPPYHITAQAPILSADSLAASADDERIASGNYQLTLTIDTLFTDSILAPIDRRAQTDTLWQIKDHAYAYERKTKDAIYNISFAKGGRTIIVKRHKTK